MSIPTPHTLGVRRYSSGTANSHGNSPPSFAAAVDWHVHAIAPGAMDEPGQANRDLSVVVYTILAPANEEVPTERDRVVYDGVEYEVNGRPADWSQGPWNFPTAGVTVELKRTDG